jgi:integrase
MKFAIDAELRTDDPTLRVKLYPEGEIHTWTDDEISQFEARWPIGTRERMAFALFLFTGQRKSDVVRMAWTDIVGKAIKVVQAKTGAKLTIALHPDLQEILKRWPRTHVAILTTAFGKPFSVAGFGNMMGDAIRGAGLPARCVSHGLRKAAARRLAEAGCSEKQIAAVTGHRTLKEVARYTRAADQERLAAQAVDKLTEQKTPRNSQPQPAGLGSRRNS